jgi:hypothetical protein
MYFFSFDFESGGLESYFFFSSCFSFFDFFSLDLLLRGDDFGDVILSGENVEFLC